MKYAIVQTVENRHKFPKHLRDFIIENFISNKDLYLDIIKKHRYLDNQKCIDWFNSSCNLNFQFSSLTERVQTLYKLVKTKCDDESKSNVLYKIKSEVDNLQDTAKKIDSATNEVDDWSDYADAFYDNADDDDNDEG